MLVVVGRVVPGGQGERNGIMERDVLCEINGQSWTATAVGGAWRPRRRWSTRW